MLSVALEREVEEYLERQRYVRGGDAAEFRGYRNGYGRERQVTIGSGAIKVRAPRVSDIPAEPAPTLDSAPLKSSSETPRSC